MADQKTERAVIVRDFNDAGTEEAFTKGDVVNLTKGAFKNYAAGGLVRVAAIADEAKPAKAG